MSNFGLKIQSGSSNVADEVKQLTGEGTESSQVAKTEKVDAINSGIVKGSADSGFSGASSIVSEATRNKVSSHGLVKNDAKNFDNVVGGDSEVKIDNVVGMDEKLAVVAGGKSTRQVKSAAASAAVGGEVKKAGKGKAFAKAGAIKIGKGAKNRTIAALDESDELEGIEKIYNTEENARATFSYAKTLAAKKKAERAAKAEKLAAEKAQKAAVKKAAASRAAASTASRASAVKAGAVKAGGGAAAGGGGGGALAAGAAIGGGGGAAAGGGAALIVLPVIALLIILVAIIGVLAGTQRQHRIEIPDDMPQTNCTYEFGSGADVRGSVSGDSNSVAVYDEWATAGAAFSNSGFAVTGNSALVAVAPIFGKSGDRIEIEFSDGSTQNAVIMDTKSPDPYGYNQGGINEEEGPAYWLSGSGWSPQGTHYGHYYSAKCNIIEFCIMKPGANLSYQEAWGVGADVKISAICNLSVVRDGDMTEKEAAIVDRAYAKMAEGGCQYVAGAAGPKDFDCSGFCSWCISNGTAHWDTAAMADSWARVSIDQRRVPDNVEPGYVYLRNPYGGMEGHAMLYVGEGKFIEMGGNKHCIHESNVEDRAYDSSGRGGWFRPPSEYIED